MTNESLLYELNHLVALAAEPYRASWVEYVTLKAKLLAKHYPEEYQTLPALLTQALNPPPCDKDTPTTGEVSR